MHMHERKGSSFLYGRFSVKADIFAYGIPGNSVGRKTLQIFNKTRAE